MTERVSRPAKAVLDCGCGPLTWQVGRQFEGESFTGVRLSSLTAEYALRPQGSKMCTRALDKRGTFIYLSGDIHNYIYSLRLARARWLEAGAWWVPGCMRTALHRGGAPLVARAARVVAAGAALPLRAGGSHWRVWRGPAGRGCPRRCRWVGRWVSTSKSLPSARPVSLGGSRPSRQRQGSAL